MPPRIPGILALVFLLASAARAEPLRPVDPVIEESGAARIRIQKGRESARGVFKHEKMPSEARWTTRRCRDANGDFYRLSFHLLLHNAQTVELTSRVDIGDTLQPVSNHVVRRNPDGEEMESSSIRFDDPAWNHPDDSYPLEMLSMVLRSFLVQNLAKSAFHVWLTDFSVYRMKVEREGTETVRGPLGTFPCVRVKVEPDIRSILSVGDVFAALLQPLMPEFVFWFRQREPHPLVRCEGPTGPPGSPRFVMELTGYRDLRGAPARECSDTREDPAEPREKRSRAGTSGPGTAEAPPAGERTGRMLSGSPPTEG